MYLVTAVTVCKFISASVLLCLEDIEVIVIFALFCCVEREREMKLNGQGYGGIGGELGVWKALSKCFI